MEITNNKNEPMEVRVTDLDPNCLECLAERLREIADRVSYCAKLGGDLTSLVQVTDGARPRYATAKAIKSFLDGSDAIQDEVVGAITGRL